MSENIWLSVIIPAYNCSNTIERLLNSICIQNTANSEIIIVDDNSTDNFMEKVEPYKEKLNIAYTKTKDREMHCPGNTRLDGLNIAQGEWVTFIDNDDEFEPGVFEAMYRGIIQSGETRVMTSSFREVLPNGEYGLIIDNGTTWMHGKFYNRQFLKDTNINFKENLYTHEDLYFNSRIFAYLRSNDLNYTILNMYTYRWNYNPDSLSRRFNQLEHSFIETYFKDYVFAGTEAWFESYKYHPEKLPFYFNQLCSVVLYCYFYYQSFLYSENPEKIIKSNLDIIKYLVYRICYTFDITKDSIIANVYSSPQSYRHIYNECISGNCDFIETISFKDFILNL
jgi:glycosyltransferase involved in cell wall biosynthesis